MIVISYATALADAVKFTDVAEENQYGESIMDLAQKRIIKGYSEDSFGADDVCTREQFITFLYRASGSPEAANNTTFTDVEAGAYYADAIVWGY